MLVNLFAMKFMKNQKLEKFKIFCNKYKKKFNVGIFREKLELEKQPLSKICAKN